MIFITFEKIYSFIFYVVSYLSISIIEMEENITTETQGTNLHKVKGLSWMLQGVNTKENKGAEQVEV